MKRPFFSILLALTAIISLNAQNMRFYDVKSIEQYEIVLEEVIEKEKMMFLVIYQVGDDFYQMQKDNIFADAQLVKAYEGTVPVAVNMKSDMGRRLGSFFPVTQFPSFLYITQEEALVYIEKGYLSRSKLEYSLYEALKASILYDKLRKKYADNELSQEEWVKLIEFQSYNQPMVETQALAVGFLNGLNKTELFSENILPLLTTYGINLEHKFPSLVLGNQKQLGDRIDYPAFYEAVYTYNFDRAVASKDTVMLEKIVTELLPKKPSSDVDIKRLSFETRKVFASDTRMFTVWKRAAITRSKDLSSDDDKAEFLFEEAYEIAENFNTPASNRAALELASLSSKAKASFKNKALEAYMAYLGKDYQKADELVKSAASLAVTESDKAKAENLQLMIARELRKTTTE